MNSRFSFALIGLFVLVLTGVFVGVVLWLSAGTTQKTYETYVAFMRESVSGLGENSSVKYLGVEVGKVRKIELDRDNPERVRLLLQIEPHVPIKEDTVAVLSTKGLTGLTHVELTGSTKDAPPLRARPGQPYRVIATRPSLFTRLEDSVPELLSELQAFAANGNQVAKQLADLLDSSNLQKTAAILESVEQLTADLSTQVSSVSAILRDATTVSQNAARASHHVPALIQRASGALEAVQEAADSIGRVTSEYERLAADSQRELHAVGRETLPQLNATLLEMQQLADALRRFTQDLEQSPGMLLYGRPARPPGPGE
ncbi:MAG: MCE family protein [Gammaproteobacteria bacterium]|nr:MCE family protein [Gammaproteobacteria bacterium]NIR84942.1 MCE family protein [Gammaproteobacteria bacterium]NIR91791.1 MCE family protein [Gammaproteobacteria bacterium]NIU05989.1 MCE family protein [Gammaproteobacteria bacterium]NIV53036.1 MCE family protein [Gammaproteobacteria bacterium]